MKKPLLAFMLLAFITLLSSCQQQNDVGRFVEWGKKSRLLDTQTGTIYKGEKSGGGYIWVEEVAPVKGKRPDQP